ncbi:hypothetical protein HYC85_017322 [Camellia sinensis]|uniref:carotenoid 9,10-dioxygenase n=1 Tax=Camellia sinensis TaxID=4442 RepID=A0A7J7H5G4_CAMSI|nr:hypothetical protein HYC85_017322 [Camellia sinensis]
MHCHALYLLRAVTHFEYTTILALRDIVCTVHLKLVQPDEPDRECLVRYPHTPPAVAGGHRLEVSADRQNLVPTGTIWSADESDKVPTGISECRWQFCLAGGALQDAESLFQHFGNFQKDKAIKNRDTKSRVRTVVASRGVRRSQALVGDLKGFFGLLMVNMQMLRAKLKVLDVSYGTGTGNTALIYHHGKLLALSEADKPYVLKVLEDGDLQTLGMLDYDKRLAHSFTAHPKVDPFTGEMFTFGYSHTPPYITYRVISKDGFMHDPVPITIPEPIMMHDFAITENYAIFMDLPLFFKPKIDMRIFGLI